MRRRWPLLLFGIVSATPLATTPIDAKVSVIFVSPDRFTDIGGLESDPAQNLADIEMFLKALGDRYLSPQVTLRIEVLDISLAGRSRWTPRTDWPVRVMTGEADWPRFELRYALESDGSSSQPVEETVVDKIYLRRLEWQYTSQSLPYEMRTLDEWFRARFVGRSLQTATFRH
jgi:hypothetical protein